MSVSSLPQILEAERLDDYTEATRRDTSTNYDSLNFCVSSYSVSLI